MDVEGARVPAILISSIPDLPMFHYTSKTEYPHEHFTDYWNVMLLKETDICGNLWPAGETFPRLRFYKAKGTGFVIDAESTHYPFVVKDLNISAW